MANEPLPPDRVGYLLAIAADMWDSSEFNEISEHIATLTQENETLIKANDDLWRATDEDGKRLLKRAESAEQAVTELTAALRSLVLERGSNKSAYDVLRKYAPEGK